MPDIFLADGAASSAIDRCTRCALTVSATGSARARAPFVRVADIFPANGEIYPLHKGAFGALITAFAVVGQNTQAKENSMSL